MLISESTCKPGHEAEAEAEADPGNRFRSLNVIGNADILETSFLQKKKKEFTANSDSERYFHKPLIKGVRTEIPSIGKDHHPSAPNKNIPQIKKEKERELNDNSEKGAPRRCIK